MGYTARAISGFGWQTALKGASSLVILAKMFVLARLLTPTDFGLFSLTTIALGLSEAVTETGINVTLLQAKNAIDQFVDTAWVIAIIRGLLIGCVMVILGLFMTDFFDQPQLTYLVGLAAVVPIVKGLINPAIVSLHKELNFVTDAGYRLSLVVVEAAISVLIVWVYPTVTSLVVALIMAGLFEVVISFVFFKVRPKFAYRPSRAAVIFGNAKWLSLSSLFSYLNENADNLLIGKAVGTYNLGLYQNAYALAHKANYDFAKSIHHSTLPIYTRMSDDKARLRRALLKTSGITLLIAGGVSLPLILAPELMIRLILGSQWVAATDLVRWLVLAGIAQALSMVVYTVFLARGSLKIMNFHQLISFIGLLGGVWFGSQLGGTWGAVVGLAVSRLVAMPILLWGLTKELSK